MSITITSLRADYRNASDTEETPYIIFNCTFKVHEDDDCRTLALKEAEDYSRVLTLGDPETYNDWITNHWSFEERYPNYGWAWTHNDPPWYYLEKFDTFHSREWISDSEVTRAIIAELVHYKKFGRFPTVYRFIDSSIILRHLRTLQSYWD